jgi:hypothetical protein
MPDPGWCTAYEAANRLGITPRSVYNYLRDGILTSRTVEGKIQVYCPAGSRIRKIIEYPKNT